MAEPKPARESFTIERHEGPTKGRYFVRLDDDRTGLERATGAPRRLRPMTP